MESAGAGPLDRSFTPSMFGSLVAITSITLAGQGAWELFVRHQPLGAVLMAVAFLVASVGATAAPYVREIERRRRRPGGGSN
jgi:hypothetical protein